MPEAIRLSPEEESLVIPEQATTVEYGRRNMNFRGKLKYNRMVMDKIAILNRFYTAALKEKECYYGPFKGEFGHFLLHNLPFIMHLHRKGVKVHYCGLDIHRPFMLDEDGKSIVASWHPLRDFFGEVRPVSNETVPPDDVQKDIRAFARKARKSGKPFLDISDRNLYWFVYRNWQLGGRQHCYRLDKVYAKGKTNSCVIFPRKKGAAVTPNNGGPWDYMKVAEAMLEHFDEVRFVGHPSLSDQIEDRNGISVCLSCDNDTTLRHCAEARMIISQHSGAVHLGAYVNTPVLLIYNGKPPIKGLVDTLRFRKNLSQEPLHYAFSLDEIVNFARSQSF